MIGSWHGLVIDCPDPQALAAFYEALLGMVRVQDSPSWVVIGDAPDRPGIAFQASPGYKAPPWPSTESTQQMHLDIRVSDIEKAESDVLALGAEPVDSQGENFRVYRDPSGHPFCLVRI